MVALHISNLRLVYILYRVIFEQYFYHILTNKKKLVDQAVKLEQPQYLASQLQRQDVNPFSDEDELLHD